jgi:NADPH:quinone reductase-like Zn-dependent oxidoreductase
VNNADLAQVAGKYPAPPGAPPDIPGLELCGDVVSVGSAVQRIAPGDRVVALVGGGAHAEFAVAHEELCISLPESVDKLAAAGFLEAYATGFDALFNQCDLRLGERVLIRGASGGVGVATVQLALLAGASVVAGVRNTANSASLEALGAEVSDVPIEETRDTYDVIVELVGADEIDADLRCLKRGGRLAVVASGAGGAAVTINAARIMSRQLQVSGGTLRGRPHDAKAELVAQIAANVLPSFISGRLSMPIHRSYPLTDGPRAFAAFAEPGKFGKIVLATNAG